MLVENVHGLELGLGHGPFFDAGKNRLEVQQPRAWRGIGLVRDPAFFTNHPAHGGPHTRLGDEVDVGIRVGLPTLAFEDGARLTAPRGIARTRHRHAKLAVGVLRVFVHGAGALQALLVAQLDAAQVEHSVLHGRQHLLAAAGGVALVQRCHNAQRQMQAGTAVANLRARHHGRAVLVARGGS